MSFKVNLKTWEEPGIVLSILRIFQNLQSKVKKDPTPTC